MKSPKKQIYIESILVGFPGLGECKGDTIFLIEKILKSWPQMVTQLCKYTKSLNGIIQIIELYGMWIISQKLSWTYPGVEGREFELEWDQEDLKNQRTSKPRKWTPLDNTFQRRVACSSCLTPHTPCTIPQNYIIYCWGQGLLLHNSPWSICMMDMDKWSVIEKPREH